MTYLQLRTRCGCSRVIQWSHGTPPPPTYEVPLTASRAQSLAYCTGDSHYSYMPEVRLFRLTMGRGFDFNGCTYYSYEED